VIGAKDATANSKKANTVELELNPLQFQQKELATEEVEEEKMQLIEKPIASSTATGELDDEVSDELKALKKNIEVKKRLRNLSLKLSTPRNITKILKMIRIN